MLVTGSSYKGIKSVSIRVSSNGLSFFNAKGDCLSSEVVSSNSKSKIEQQIKYLRKLSSKLTLISESDNFVMIPKELYKAEYEYAYFMAKSLPYDSSKLQFRLVEIADAVVVIALESYIMDIITAHFDQIEISHPVIETLKISLVTDKLVFHLTGSERCAISYSYDQELKFTDYLPSTTIIDVVYYIQRMITRYMIELDEEIVYTGALTADLVNLLKQNIKNPISHHKNI